MCKVVLPEAGRGRAWAHRLLGSDIDRTRAGSAVVARAGYRWFVAACHDRVNGREGVTYFPQMRRSRALVEYQ